MSSTVRLGLAASAILSVVFLPQALALKPALPSNPSAAPAGADRGEATTQIATPDLIQELTTQGLRSVGLSSEDAARLASRALPLAKADDASMELDALADDAEALGAVDAASARDVFARMESVIARPLVTTDSVGRAFGVSSDGPGMEVLGFGPVTSGPGIPVDRDPMLGGTCQSCPAFDFGPFTPTTVWQFHNSTISPGSDCNWYAFDVTNGSTYQFATCAPGSATFDTVIEVFSSSCGFLASNDNACGSQSQVQWTATFNGQVRVKVRGFGGANGSYNLGYRRVCLGDPDCSLPDLTLPNATTTCQFQSGAVNSCTDARFYRIHLFRGMTYTFTTCGGTCSGAGASFDSVVELYSPAGSLLSSNSNACGDDGEVTFTTDPVTGEGDYCVVVRREAGATDDFNLGYRVACQAPNSVTIAPDNASTAEPDCTRNQTWTATTLGTGPFNWSWTITPTAGQSATPSSGSATTTSSNTLTFTSMLQGSGDYTVSVTVSNDCGSDGHTITFNLEDRAGPVLTPTAEQVSCGTTTIRRIRRTPAAPVLTPRHAAEQLGTLPESEISAMLADPDPNDVADRIAQKLGLLRKNVTIFDASSPGLSSPPGTRSLSCPSPCTSFNTLEADNLYYDVFLSCDDGSFTARTGVAHSVTITSGAQQNVIYGGSYGGPGTSDASWYVHDTGDHYINPTGGAACLFNPPDSPAEPGNIGIEDEWTRTPSGMPGVTLKLREEIVAFGDTEANSGVRLTLGATNLASSTSSVTMGVRWQIDYQNGGDDGPLFAQVVCEPFGVTNERSTEHEFSDAEIATFDFYRIQNNTGSPIFGNFTNTTAIGGFPDTGKPDRLTYARWGSVVGTSWNYTASEGDPNPDYDSAVLYWFGFAPADGIPLAPGETFTRSVIIFSAGTNADCGERLPGECATQAELEICPGECARVGATAVDGCSTASVSLVSTSPGAPPCSGNPCVMSFPNEGDFVYTWQATDTAGNQVECTSTVHVHEGPDCNNAPSCNAGGPASGECREAALNPTVDDFDGDEIHFSWTSDNPNVTVDPPSGTIAAGFGPRAFPPTFARLDASQDPCGVIANLTLTVDDGRGGVSSCSTTAFFQDLTPPVVTGSSATSGGAPDVCLWPPNHWYVPVDASMLSVTVTDCSSTTWTIAGCVSDQPEDAPERPDIDAWNGDGHTVDDCVVSADGHSLWVRSERCGGGVNAQDGRHYGIAVIAVDACGNASPPTIAGKIYVPHDQSPAEDGCLNPTESGGREVLP